MVGMQSQIITEKKAEFRESGTRLLLCLCERSEAIQVQLIKPGLPRFARNDIQLHFTSFSCILFALSRLGVFY